ncbi:MAG: lysophospholipid acyltransferase family protein [Thermoanaerobaculia bacterium]
MAATLRRRLRTAAFRILMPGLQALLAPLPFAAVLACGRGLARILWLCKARERRRMVEHLALAFPALPAAERRRLAKGSALHHGMNLAENLHLLWRGPRRILPRIAVEGWEEVAALHAAGRRILLLTGHCGNWELLAAVVPARGLPLFGFGRGLEDPALQEAIVRLRERLGGSTIVRSASGSAGQLRRVLRGEGALAMFIDQDTQVEGAWVPFFGRPAYTPLAAAQLSLRHRMAVVPAFLARLPDGTHRCRFLPELGLPADPVAATALMTRQIEEQIRRCPEQWVWMHRRWRRQPSADGAS